MEAKIKRALPYVGLVLCFVVGVVFCVKVYSILTDKPSSTVVTIGKPKAAKETIAWKEWKQKFIDVYSDVNDLPQESLPPFTVGSIALGQIYPGSSEYEEEIRRVRLRLRQHGIDDSQLSDGAIAMARAADRLPWTSWGCERFCKYPLLNSQSCVCERFF